jgi:RNA polymerase sigma factor (sigma-70 family)
MNIHELDSYNLGDAVKFNDKLNPRIWGADEKMRPEVREQLLKIADDFREFLGIDVEVKDITVSGSNAAYTYTPHSDIDLHLVVDLPEADRNEVYRELFDAKKYAYNEQHDIRIGGYDVELYVQNANKPHHSQGIYSLINDNWVSVPKRRQPDVDDISVKSKFEDLGYRIESAIKSQDYEKISAMAEKIKDYRQAGLDAHGEFGPENLAFKILRKQGLIQKLYDARNAAKDELLSLDERKKKKKRKSVKYGYGGYWYPGYAYAGQDHPAGTEGGDGGGDGGGESVREDAGMTWDGVNPTTDMFTSEDASATWDGVNPTTAMFTTETQDPTNEEILQDFVEFCVKELKIEQMPRVKLRKDPQWPAVHKTFGRYNDESKTLEVSWGQRHIMDVLRTVAHELTHKHQHEREGEQMGPDAGETGSPYENEANARAGVLMRDYGRLHPEYFTVGQAHDLEEANPSQQLSLYKPDGTTYRGEKMPGYDPDDFHSDTNPRKRIDRLTHRDLSNRTATDLVDPIERAEQNIDKERLKDAIRASMSSLTSRETAVLNMRFWKDLTLAQTAKALNSSPERIRQIEAKALRKLRHESRSDRLEPFVKEGASGYIPTKAQAKDPRYSMALTVDIKPGQVGKEANKLKLKTNRQGAPQIARADGLFENLYKEYKKYKADEDYSPDEPPGPEFKPTMPAGTLRVDVSDVYDWYKLGQHIANMKGLGQHDFGQGPPSAIVSFGDEDTEHKFIKDIKATGLDVTDIDPVDPKQPPGKKIKTDPTYNVDEAINAPVSKNQDAEQYYRFILGKAKLGRPLTRNEQDYVKMYQVYRQQKLAESAEILDEVAMSPGALQKWAKSPEAQGIRAGFEAELIFRDTTNDDDDDGEMEPDYDYDERARSVSQVIDFFNGGDFGGLGPRQESQLQDGLDNQYIEWMDERMYDAFRDEQEDLIKKVLVDEEWDEDNEIQKQLALLDLTNDEINEIINAGERAPRFTKSSEQQAYIQENPLYQKYMDAQTEAEGLLDELVQDSIRAQDKFYDAALDDFRENFYIDDDSDFFSDVGLSYMSDIASEYNLDWPYMTGSGDGNNGGSRDWEDIGTSLQSAIDMPVKVSSNYHSTTRKEGQWIVEPDSSLDPDDREDFGLEIVSPPLPLLDALEKLQEVTDWANNPSEGNAYTNQSTGLHMGVSVPYKGGDVDYLKLILFLGDEYVLQSFGREANTYTKSAMQKFRENIKSGRADPAGALMLMKNNLIEFAQREIQKGVGTSKYTSAHIQDGYIEFRSAGGDWLAEESADPQKLSSTMLRYARAMQIAANPAEERREYAKKLYKLVAPEGDSQLALFSQFAAGAIDKDELKKQWAEKTIGTERKMNQRWKLYNRATGEPVPGQEYNGYTEEEARARAKGKISPGSSDRDFDAAYELRNIGQEQQWEVYNVNTGETLEIVKGRNKGEAADAVFDKYANQGIGFNVRPYQDPATMTPRAKLAKRLAEPKAAPVALQNYEVVDRRDVNLRVVGRFQAQSEQDAPEKYSLWLKTNNLPDDTDAYGYRKTAAKSGQTAGVQDVDTDVAQNFGLAQAVDGTGELMWEIFDRQSGRAIEEIIAANLADAKSEAEAWLESIGAGQPELFGVRPKLEA